MQHSSKSETRRPEFRQALVKLLVFQLKLGADALRDILLSLISIIMFLLDIVLRTPPQDSYHERLMQLGRKSDRLINLFDEYPDYLADLVEKSRNKQSDES